MPDYCYQYKQVPDCSQKRHDPVEDQEPGLDLGHEDEGLLRVAGVKGAVLLSNGWIIHSGEQI